MVPAINATVKANVINRWLSGDTRDVIAKNNARGTGTVSNVIDDWKKDLDDVDYDSVRTLVVWAKKEGLCLEDKPRMLTCKQ